MKENSFIAVIPTFCQRAVMVIALMSAVSHSQRVTSEGLKDIIELVNHERLRQF